MTGHLSLVCAGDENGRSFLREQSFNAPMHISKPFHESGTLVVNVVNPTAGFFAGDEVTWRVRVEKGARLLLASPSAQRVHRTGEGSARLRQEFFVADGGFLEVLPELFIAQGGASYSQKTTIEAERGAEFIFFEMFAPGRVAMGERFAFERLEWATDVMWAGTPALRERYRLSPGDESLEALQARGYYASCFAFGASFGAEADCWRAIAELHGEEAWVGCGSAAAGGGVVKILASGSIALRRTVASVRRALHAALGREPAALRRM